MHSHSTDSNQLSFRVVNLETERHFKHDIVQTLRAKAVLGPRAKILCTTCHDTAASQYSTSSESPNKLHYRRAP